jgi:hypothetical protein
VARDVEKTIRMLASLRDTVRAATPAKQAIHFQTKLEYQLLDEALYMLQQVITTSRT